MDLHIRPLERTLRVEAGVNLLEALRAHDIPVSYSCLAGRCGTCRCKVVAGQVLEAGGEQRPPQALEAADTVLACQTFITEDCTVEIAEPDEVVVHTARIVKATVVGIDAPTHDIRRLRLKPAKPLDFSPGQYVQLQFTPDQIRPYSMASLCTDGELEFHVRCVPDGLVSGYIANGLKLGDTVRVTGPLGSAYLRRKHTGPMLCVAGGTGLAPILSIVRGVVAAGMQNPIHLYLGVRAERDVYGQAWLAELQSKYPALQVHTVVASGRAPGCRSGLVTDAIEHDWPSLSGFRAYLCGAPPMVEATSRLVSRLGVLPEQIYADAFYASGT